MLQDLLPTKRLPVWLTERRLFVLSMQRRRLIYLVAIAVSLFLLLERYVPELSGLVIVTAFMALYTLFLTAILVVKRRKANKAGGVLEPLAPAEWPKVCVLVPAHNEQAVIANTIDHLLALDYPHFELLVIDDRSQDRTRMVLQAQLEQKHMAGESRFRFVVREADATPGKSAVLNDAMALTDAPLMAIFDADARVAPNWLTQLVPYVLEAGTAAVQARKVISNSEVNWLTLCQNWEYTFDAHLQCCRDWAKGAVELRGNGQLVKRAVMEPLDGWNEASITDDLDLSTRLHLQGWDIRFVPHVLVREEGVSEFWPLIRQRCRWAEGSLRRYLEYGGGILFSPNTPFRARVDMVAYFVHFLFPLLIFADNVLVMATFILGMGSTLHALLSFSILPLFALMFIPTFYYGIRRFSDRPTRLESLRLAFHTGIYMTIVWAPVVFYTFAKVLVAPQQFHWSKTTHYGENDTAASPAV
jgi:1,2-diacylglycerol 3-beta-glucosyltransferase